MLNSRLIIAIFPGLLGFDLQSKKIGKLRSTLVPFLAIQEPTSSTLPETHLIGVFMVSKSIFKSTAVF